MNTVAVIPPLKSKKRWRKCDMVVLHATVSGGARGSIRYLRTKGYAYGYVIAKDGTIHKCHVASRWGYHAGKSRGPWWPWVRGVSSKSVGICFVNWNNGRDPYTFEQYESCRLLILALSNQHPLRYVSGHFGISPGRKTDPRGFPMIEMAYDTDLEYWLRKDAEDRGGPKTDLVWNG